MSNRRNNNDDSAHDTQRIAIVHSGRCHPRHCKRECKKNCPVNRMGKACIEVKRESKLAFISEILCIGCNICIKKCPFEAIQIVNIPTTIKSKIIHRYGPNSYTLYQIPIARQNKILGIVGPNGIGKSTALKLLSGKKLLNLGNYQDVPQLEDIYKHFEGTSLQNYFKGIIDGDLSTVMKPQYVDHIPNKVKQGMTVKKLLKKKDERKLYKSISKTLELDAVLKREIINLSGGELQRFAIGICCCRDVDVYIFDEPSSYLDIKQKLNVVKVIRNLLSKTEKERRIKKYGKSKDPYIMVVDHDLAFLDYISDFICIVYGIPGAFGIVTMPFGVREGINIFLSGFIQTENIRIRDFELNFKNINNYNELSRLQLERNKIELLCFGYIRNNAKGIPLDIINIIIIWMNEDDRKYPSMTKTLGSFKLIIESGWFREGEIVVLLGENGSGKTTFIKLMAGLLKPDDENTSVPELKVSYKPQKISPTFDDSVQSLFHKRIRSMYIDPQFITDVIKPLKIQELYDKMVTHLCGGNLERVALTLALGSPADVYLIDEVSSYLDSEQRIIVAKVIKRFIKRTNKAAFVVDHDFIMTTYLADNVIVFEGEPGKQTIARTPLSLLHGINMFLKNMDITVQRDPKNWRLRINKYGSIKDIQQRKSNNYFYLDSSD